MTSNCARAIPATHTFQLGRFMPPRYPAGGGGSTVRGAPAGPGEAIARETGLPETKVSAYLRMMIAKGHIAVSPAGFSTK
jgi:hypothetical protein